MSIIINIKKQEDGSRVLVYKDKEYPMPNGVADSIQSVMDGYELAIMATLRPILNTRGIDVARDALEELRETSIKSVPEGVESARRLAEKHPGATFVDGVELGIAITNILFDGVLEQLENQCKETTLN